MALDDERTSFRYHHLVRQLLRAELRARDPGREKKLQLRAAEWFEAAGDTRRAARHFLAAGQGDRALALLHDRVVADFLHDPALPEPLDLSMVDPSVLAGAPDRLMAVAIDLLLGATCSRRRIPGPAGARPAAHPARVPAGGPVRDGAGDTLHDGGPGRSGRRCDPRRAGHPGPDSAQR